MTTRHIILGTFVLIGLCLALLVADLLERRARASHATLLSGDPARPDLLTQPRRRPESRPAYELPPALTTGRVTLGMALLGAAPGFLLLLQGLPILAAPAFLGVLLAPVGLARYRLGRWYAALDEVAVVLCQQVALQLAGGVSLYAAIERLCEEGLAEPIRSELRAFVVQRIASGEDPVEVFRSLAKSPRYAATFYYRRLLVHLAACQHGRLTPERIAARLQHLAEVMAASRAIRQRLDVRLAQAKYSRWLVTAIVPVTALILVRLTPDFGNHLLHHPAGNIALLVAFGLAGLANVISGRIAQVKPLEI